MPADVDADREKGLPGGEIDQLGGVVFLIGDKELGVGRRREEEASENQEGGFHGQSIGQGKDYGGKKIA